MVVTNNLVAKFQGGVAEAHRLPAYDAARSLYGISRSVLITLNYLAEGKVRRREFAPQTFQFHIVTQRPGSFETLFEIVANTDAMVIAGGLTSGVAGNFLTDFIRSVFRRCVGQKGEPDIERLETDGKLNAGDLSALEDAIEPAMREAHAVVNRGASQIILISGDHNVVTLDHATKEYVQSSIEDENIKAKNFSIASYNANQRSGRAFDFELGKTVPFEIAKGADRETLEAVLSSMSSYAFRRMGDNLKSALGVQYISIVAIDGKIKRIIILKARKELADL